MNPDLFDTNEARLGKGLALLAYLNVLLLIPLFAAKGNRFVLYHANQGLLLLVTQAVCGVVTKIPFIGFVGNVGLTGCFLLMILGLVAVVQGQVKPLPLIGQFTLIKSY